MSKTCKMTKMSTKADALLRRAEIACDCIEQAAGDGEAGRRRAPAAAMLAARMLFGTGAEFRAGLAASVELMSWEIVQQLHANAANDDDDDDDDGDD